MDKNTDKALDNIYKFMADTYEGNWTYRWSGVPKNNEVYSLKNFTQTAGLFSRV